MLSYYFCLMKLSFYKEYNFVITYSLLGSIKIKDSFFSNFYIKLNILFSRNIISSFKSFLNRLFKTINIGSVNKFSLTGVGYRKFYSDNIVVYKLRYSHLIYKILPLNVLDFKKHKRRKFFSLFSLNQDLLNKVTYRWLSYRITNIYTKKGFLKKDKKMLFKERFKKLL